MPESTTSANIQAYKNKGDVHAQAASSNISLKEFCLEVYM